MKDKEQENKKPKHIVSKEAIDKFFCLNDLEEFREQAKQEERERIIKILVEDLHSFTEDSSTRVYGRRFIIHHLATIINEIKKKEIEKNGN